MLCRFISVVSETECCAGLLVLSVRLNVVQVGLLVLSVRLNVVQVY